MLQRLRQRERGPVKKLEQLARAAALGQIESEEQRARDAEQVDEALAAFGLYAVRDAPAPAEPIYLWPENVPSWNLFQACSTQWVPGTDGVIGLNYPGVEIVIRMAGVKRNKQAKYFSDIQVMERATLAAWSERRK